MCGITGYLGFENATTSTNVDQILSRMSSAIKERGPDDFGFWSDVSAGVGMAHRRLSIIDLSPAGHQPMASQSGRYILVFNGEIYNHLNLRKILEAQQCTVNWRGHSDTETLLAGFDVWGIQATIEKTIGMFAIAIWDRELRELVLARDRLGEKPLYYGWQGSGEKASFLFGSELSALKAHPSFSSSIDRNALCLLMRHNYIPAPHSIYQGICKLSPGTILKVSLAHRALRPETYWSLSAIAEEGVSHGYDGSCGQAVDELAHLLKSAVRQQMASDVPLGAFLSGGIDSSSIVALMQSQSSDPVQTFTIGFSEDGYNEAVHAKLVAQHLGTNHTELYVSPKEAMDVIPRLPSLYNEPFADSSQIPTFLVSQLARRHVTVALSGDAGDELFGGYNRYVVTRNLWRKLANLPAPVRQKAAFIIKSASPKAWQALLNPLQRVLPKSRRYSNVGDKLHKGADVMSASSIDELYLRLVSQWDPASIVLGGTEPSTIFTGQRPNLSGLDSIQRMMALDTISYLPDDILVKVDRAAMGVSLEGRVPFLDHRVVEFAWRLPQSLKLRNGVGKWILRQVLYRYVPRELIERPKMGFGVPIDHWLRGPLREWAESLLDEARLRREGYLNPLPIRQRWAEHLSGNRNWQYHIWTVLMFQAWLESNHAP